MPLSLGNLFRHFLRLTDVEATGLRYRNPTPHGVIKPERPSCQHPGVPRFPSRSLVPLVDKRGPQITMRALGRLFGELPLILICLGLSGGGAQALDWTSTNGYRWAAVQPVGAGKVGFTLMPGRDTGVTFTNIIRESTYFTNQIYLNGSGVAAGDVDGDGLCDVYFAGLDGPNALYRNLGGWKFDEIASRAGVGCDGLWCTGVSLVDLDGDGDLDLVVNTVGQGTRLFGNDGRGNFSALGPVLNEGKGGMSLALADIDGDGDLDLYVVNYRTSTLRDLPNTRFRGKKRDGAMVLESVNGRPVTEPDLVGRFTLDAQGRVEEHGEAHVLFLNDGKGRFTPESLASGRFLDQDGKPLKEPFYDWGLAAMFRDLNGDAAPDLYVCNDFSSPDRVWINDGKGGFRLIPPLAIRHTSHFSMGVDFADLDRDGFVDFFATEMLGRTHRLRHTGVVYFPPPPYVPGVFENRPQVAHQNTLFKNRGDATFAEVAWFAGVQAADWSWTPMFLDVDLDGFEDLLVTTGHERELNNMDVSDTIDRERRGKNWSAAELLAMKARFPRLALPNVAFRNLGGMRFADAGHIWGFDQVSVSHGMAATDLDNDGDLDLILNNLNGETFMLRNDAPGPRIAVRLRGSGGNTRGIGARIELEGGPFRQSQEMTAAGRYLSSDDPARVFAAGGTFASGRLVVRWRSGKRSNISPVRPNVLYEVSESTASAEELEALDTPKAPRFVDESGRLDHRHVDQFFDEFARQPLLPGRLAHSGPRFAVEDLNGDRHQDLVISGGTGGELGIHHGDGKGGFARNGSVSYRLPISDEQSGVLILSAKGLNAGPRIVVGHSYYEGKTAPGPILSLIDVRRGVVVTNFPINAVGAGAMAAGDYNGDGQTDFFVAGGCRPGRYPEAGPSFLLQQRDGEWRVDEISMAILQAVGLVNAACWSDLNGDGFPELVLACEWGPIRVFLNERGKLREVTDDWGLTEWTGLWSCIAAEDFNGDGKTDLIVGNWGLNSRYRPDAVHPRRLYYGAEDPAAPLDLVEAHFDDASGQYVPDRLFRHIKSAMPFIEEVASTHEAYAQVGVEKLLGARRTRMRVAQASRFASVILLNRISLTDKAARKFEVRELPSEAQWTPVQAVCVGDFDHDGRMDLVLSQNFFGTNLEMARQDAGRGLLMRGDGRGNFSAMPGVESGVMIYGEQRGAVTGDFDEDGWLDLVIGQNGGQSRLLRNTGGR